MSHHLDSPIARQDIRLDLTDLYVFRGERGTVFAIDLCHSIFGPIPVPGYHPEGMYEFKVDLDGDAVEDLATALRSTSVTATEGSGMWCAVSAARRLSTRTRQAPSLHGELPARRSVRLPACAYGRAKPVTRSGSSPMCYMRWAMRFKTVRL